MSNEDTVYAVKQHYVVFLSPGTFLAEPTTKEVDEWDVAKAVEMADGISQRHGATPYGFYFMTRARKADELDAKEIASSPMYYLGGEIVTIDTIRSRALKEEEILLSNMEGNGWNRIIINTNSWKVHQPLNPGDIVLDYTPPAKRKKASVGA